jgi:predicted acylesterase/phospholipase RssA
MYHNIAVSGGGVSALVFVGCIKRIYEDNEFFQLSNYIGSSSGSLICLFMILNYSYEEIKSFLSEHLVDSPVLKLTLWNVPKCFSKYGIDDGKNVIEFVEKILEFKGFSKNASFIEITKQTGKNLIVAATNLTCKKLEYLSVDNYPEMMIKTAIRMSTSIPILYQPVKYYDEIFVDSLIYNNFPIDVFSKMNRQTFGLNVLMKPKKITNLMSFFGTIIHCMINNITVVLNSEQKNVCNIVLDDVFVNFNLQSFKFEVTEGLIDKYVQVGYEKMSSFLQ